MNDALQIVSPPAAYPTTSTPLVAKADANADRGGGFAGAMQQASATLTPSPAAASQSASTTTQRVQISVEEVATAKQPTVSTTPFASPVLSGDKGSPFVQSTLDGSGNEIPASGEAVQKPLENAIPGQPTLIATENTATKEAVAGKGDQVALPDSFTAAKTSKTPDSTSIEDELATDQKQQTSATLTDESRPVSAKHSAQPRASVPGQTAVATRRSGGNASRPAELVDDAESATDGTAETTASLAGSTKLTITTAPAASPDTKPTTLVSTTGGNDPADSGDPSVTDTQPALETAQVATPHMREHSSATKSLIKPQSIAVAKESSFTTQRTPEKSGLSEVAAAPENGQAVASVPAMAQALAASGNLNAALPTQSNGTQVVPLSNTSDQAAVTGPANTFIPGTSRNLTPTSKIAAAKPADTGSSAISPSAAAPVEAGQAVAPAAGHTSLVAHSDELLAAGVSAGSSVHQGAAFTPSGTVSHGSDSSSTGLSAASAAASRGIDSMTNASTPQGIRRDGALEVGYHDTTLGWLSVRASLDRTGDIQAALGSHNPAAASTVSNMLPALNRFLQEQSVSVQSVTSSSHMAAGVGKDATAQAGSAGTASFSQSQQQPGAEPNSDRQQQRNGSTPRSSDWGRRDLARDSSTDANASAVAPRSMGSTSTVSVRI